MPPYRKTPLWDHISSRSLPPQVCKGVSWIKREGKWRLMYLMNSIAILLHWPYFTPWFTQLTPEYHPCSQSLRATGSPGGFGCCHWSIVSFKVVTLRIEWDSLGGAIWWLEDWVPAAEVEGGIWGAEGVKDDWVWPFPPPKDSQWQLLGEMRN